MGGEGEIDVFFQAVEAAAEDFPVFLARLDKIREAAELDSYDRCLETVEGTDR
jgi:hypothetical protein